MEKELELDDISELVTMDNLDEKIEENIDYLLFQKGYVDYKRPLATYKNAKMCSISMGPKLSGEFVLVQTQDRGFEDYHYEGAFSLYGYGGGDYVGDGMYVARLDACKDEECILDGLHLFIDTEDAKAFKKMCVQKESQKPVISEFLVPYTER